MKFGLEGGLRNVWLGIGHENQTDFLVLSLKCKYTWFCIADVADNSERPVLEYLSSCLASVIR